MNEQGNDDYACILNSPVAKMLAGMIAEANLSPDELARYRQKAFENLSPEAKSRYLAWRASAGCPDGLPETTSASPIHIEANDAGDATLFDYAHLREIESQGISADFAPDQVDRSAA